MTSIKINVRQYYQIYNLNNCCLKVFSSTYTVILPRAAKQLPLQLKLNKDVSRGRV